MKLKDAFIIAFGLVLAAAPAEYFRMAVMRWDALWFMHEDTWSPSGVIHDLPVCPNDGTPMDLKPGDKIRLFDPNERAA